MGLKNNTNSGEFVRFTEGKFYLGKDKNKETPYDMLEGQITEFSLQDDEYEGRPIRKLIIKMTDGENNYILNILFESVYSSHLISFLKNADLKKPLALVGVSKDDENGTKRHSILVKQNGEFVKAYYSKKTPNGMPQMKEVVINKKKQWDKSEMIDFLENVVLNDFNKVVSGNKVEKSTQEKINASITEEIVDLNDDDLPF